MLVREFARELSALAQQHGVRVLVRSRGWDEPLPKGTEEGSWM